MPAETIGSLSSSAPRPPAGRGSRGYRHWLPLSLILAAWTMRVSFLGRQSLWYDEAFSALLARYDLGEITRRTALDTMPPLYYYILHVQQAVAGLDDFSLRFLSAAFGVGCVALVLSVGRKLFDSTVGLVAAGITAISPFQVFYGQEARMYTLLGFLSLLVIFLLLRAWDANDLRSWIPYAVATAALLYVHNLAALTLVPVAAVVVFRRFRAGKRLRGASTKSWSIRSGGRLCPPGAGQGARPTPPLADTAVRHYESAKGLPDAPLRGLLFAHLGAILLFSPWLVVSLQQAERVARSFWVSPPTAFQVPATFYVFLFGGSLPPLLWPAGLFLVLLSLGIFGLRAYRAAVAAERASLAVVVLWLVAPPIFSYLVSLWRPIYLERTLIVSSYALYLFVGWGLARLRPRGVSLALGLLLVALCGISLGRWYFDATAGKPPLRLAASYVRAHAGPGDAVAHTSDGSYLPFALYLGREQSLLLGDPEREAGTARAQSTYVALGIEPDSFEQAARGHERTWLIVAPDHSVEWQLGVREELSRRYPLLESTDIRGIWMGLYDTRGIQP
ncbi:MAG: hypothetical protein EPO21_01350 [Chloroflexota bacterium]|nr:MAG: hypothetical protein EPO21_01350 [Chloroflexota bacterium]